MKKKLTISFVIATTGLVCLWLLRSWWLPFVADNPVKLVEKRFNSGTVLTDRYNHPLRIYPDRNGDLHFYLPLASHSQQITQTVLTAEDRNFFQHPGFNIFSIVRATWQNLINLKIISGASTISQQLIRILKPRPRTFKSKFQELFSALLLESKYSKKEILEFYLNSVPMFGNIRGFNLASMLLFKKSPQHLNLAESATLAALVQSPGRLSPFDSKSNKLLRKRRDWIIREMIKLGYCTLKQGKEAIKTNIPEYKSRLPLKAPHFCNLIQQNGKLESGKVRTTISLPLQNLLDNTLRSHLSRIADYGARQLCGMIVNVPEMEILAMVGSAEFGPIAGGYNNGCFAKRSGGSSLKPFLYALAFEQGFYPSFVIPDTMRTYKTPQGEYLANNANKRSYGPVSIRTALGNSLNISAVKMLNLIGIKSFYKLLVETELLEETKGAADFYGLGLAIGNPEIKMIDLAQAYGIFANQGKLKSISMIMNEPVREKQIFSEATSYLIYEILSDPTARLFTFGNPDFFKFKNRWALKTGTSTNYRDSWLTAFNGNYIISLWVGNFDGSPTRALSGTTACGPILKDIISDLGSRAKFSAITKPSGVKSIEVCAISGKKTGKLCSRTALDLISKQSRPKSICDFHKKEAVFHELEADYAIWLRNRARKISLDPFKLKGFSQIADPYKLPGISVNKQKKAADSKKNTSNLSSTGNKQCTIKIVSPHNNDTYLMSNYHENFLHLRAIPEGSCGEIIWMINGNEFIRTSPPYEAYWPMKPGKHTITALGESEFASQITISVED
ncbi:MAG: penicillin-binding protein 1C [Candidatus Rifleibacteriota bacterium]